MTKLYPENPVLIVDDEPDFLLGMAYTLRANGINNVFQCVDSREALELFRKDRFSLVILDMNMPHISGMELLGELNVSWPDLPVVVLTAVDEVDNAVECIRMGAFDYIVKPADGNRVVSSVSKALEYGQVKSENARLKHYLVDGKLSNPDAFSHIVTESDSMLSLFRYIEAISRSDAPLLITGETGTGKELVARAVHNVGAGEGKFVAFNVAGLDDNYFSDTLFGHEKGAFTGAGQRRSGLIESAAGGTIFLDEIGDLAPETQIKLLRILQEKLYYPLGSDKPRKVDARIVLATNRDLNRMVDDGSFRRDLFYRLTTHQVKLPPLRERIDDIPMLLDHFLEKASKMMGKRCPTPPRELYTLLNTHNFPGNVRELEAMVTDAVGRHISGVLSMEAFRERIFSENEEAEESSEDEFEFPETLPRLKEFENMLIDEAYRRSGGNQTIAAKLLGMSRRAFNNRIMRRKG